MALRQDQGWNPVHAGDSPAASFIPWPGNSWQASPKPSPKLFLGLMEMPITWSLSSPHWRGMLIICSFWCAFLRAQLHPSPKKWLSQLALSSIWISFGQVCVWATEMMLHSGSIHKKHDYLSRKRCWPLPYPCLKSEDFKHLQDKSFFIPFVSKSCLWLAQLSS